MNSQEFKDYISQSDVIIIDVRSPQEFAGGHIKDARNINMYSPSFMDEIKTLDRAGKYALYCASGGRSEMAMQFMKSQGFDNVEHLDGGIIEWQMHGLPINR